jgi:hypothetical protein
MIPTIGIVICAYVITRMLELAWPGDSRSRRITLALCAALTIVIAVTAFADLVLRGTTNLSLDEAIRPIR